MPSELKIDMKYIPTVPYDITNVFGLGKSNIFALNVCQQTTNFACRSIFNGISFGMLWLLSHWWREI